jgi:hypothetical protein
MQWPHSLDELLSLEWLFPSRGRKVQWDELPHLGVRGVCQNKGYVSPWTNRPCKCEGYKFKKHYRGTSYCKCGCQASGHPYKSGRL